MPFLSRRISCQDCGAKLAKSEQGNKAGEADRKQLEAKLTAERKAVAKLQQQLASLEESPGTGGCKSWSAGKNVG